MALPFSLVRPAGRIHYPGRLPAAARAEEATGPLFRLALSLFSDGPASEAGSGVAGGIGDVVIRVGMDHQRSPLGLKQGILGAFLQGDQGGHHLEAALAILTHLDIRQVSGVRSLRVLQTMLFAERIEMASGSHEIRAVAGPFAMDVAGMVSGGQVLHFENDLNPLGGLG